MNSTLIKNWSYLKANHNKTNMCTLNIMLYSVSTSTFIYLVVSTCPVVSTLVVLQTKLNLRRFNPLKILEDSLQQFFFGHGPWGAMQYMSFPGGQSNTGISVFCSQGSLVLILLTPKGWKVRLDYLSVYLSYIYTF